jgi:hypothetical protein
MERSMALSALGWMIRRAEYRWPISLTGIGMDETVSMALEYSPKPVSCRLSLENQNGLVCQYSILYQTHITSMPLKNPNRLVGEYHPFIQKVICLTPLEIIQTIMAAAALIF